MPLSNSATKNIGKFSMFYLQGTKKQLKHYSTIYFLAGHLSIKLNEIVLQRKQELLNFIFAKSLKARNASLNFHEQNRF